MRTIAIAGGIALCTVVPGSVVRSAQFGGPSSSQSPYLLPSVPSVPSVPGAPTSEVGEPQAPPAFGP